MSNRIFTQRLVVYYKQHVDRRQTITYMPLPVTPDQPPLPPTVRAADWDRIRQSVDLLHFQMHQLLTQAVCHAPRNEVGIEKTTRDLGRLVLPPGGFADLMVNGLHPCMDTTRDEMAAIPWESLEENYFQCPEPQCGEHTDPLQPVRGHPVCCSRHPVAMIPAGGKLALKYHLSHLVPSEGRPAGTGNLFLIINDPTGDLSVTGGATNSAVCEHVARLEQMLKAKGFSVMLLSGTNAGCEQVLQCIARPDLAGIYYFGHGLSPTCDGQGRLILSNGTIRACDIDECGTSARFVFLNACEAAAVTASTGVNDSLSIAEAFARSGAGRVVIAPAWPIVTEQAVRCALTFFEKTCGSAMPFGHSLMHVRQESLKAYESGQPNACWMSYRYFGDPNGMLAETAVPPNLGKIGEIASCENRAFGADGRLKVGVFGFSLEDVLIRAAKRRMLQGRDLVSVGDLIAGLVRKGELTRYVIKEGGRDPDALYQQITLHKDVEEEGPGRVVGSSTARRRTGKTNSVTAKEKRTTGGLERLLAEFIVRDRSDFTPAAADALCQADRASQVHSDQGVGDMVTEHDLLSQLLRTAAWGDLLAVGIPSAEESRRILDGRKNARIDENGVISLRRLSAKARRVIHDAHTLAQQRGVFPIGSRVLLAAFLGDADGYGARVCRAARTPLPSELLCKILRATVEETGSDGSKCESRHKFLLSRDACSRIVTPVLLAAERDTVPDQPITEEALFKAFCSEVPGGLKDALRARLYLDLDMLKEVVLSSDSGDAVPNKKAEGHGSAESQSTMKSSSSEQRGHRGDPIRDAGLDSDVCRILSRSIALARSYGRSVVNSPYLFAALVEDSSTPLHALLGGDDQTREEVQRLVLSLLPKQPTQLTANQPIMLSPNTRQILDRAKRSAEIVGRPQASPDDVFASFFADGGGVVGQLLMAIGLRSLGGQGQPATSVSQDTSSDAFFSQN